MTLSDRSLPLLENTALSWGTIGKSASIRAEITIRKNPGTSLHPSSIRKFVKKYSTKAGVRKSGVHTLRHTFSAHNVNNGMPIADLQKVLGHKKKETTLTYIHVVSTSLRATLLKTQA